MLRITLLILLLTLFCNLKLSSQNYPVAEIPDNLKTNAIAVVRNYWKQYKITSIDNIDIVMTEVVTILNKAGEKHAFIRLPYNKSNRTNDVKIKIYDENGKHLKTYTKRDMEDVSYNSQYELYGDERLLYININHQTFPYTVEVQTKMNSSNTIFLPTLIPFYDYEASVENMGIEIINKSGILLRKKLRKIILLKPL